MTSADSPGTTESSAEGWRQPGFDATSPCDIPRRGWWQILRRIWTSIEKDQLPLVSAGLAFFAMLGLFPALSTLVAIYGLALDPQDIAGQSQVLTAILPAEAHQLVDQQLRSLFEAKRELGIGLALSLLLLLWTASTGTAQLIRAVNLAYGEEETRSFLHLRMMSLVFTVGALLFLVFAVALLAVVPSMLRRFWLDQAAQIIIGFLRWPLLGISLVTALSMLYRFGPDRAAARWRWVSWGSVIATLLWLAGSALFSLYVSRFGSYNETYGALGAVVVLLLWLYLSAFILLLGAEINSEAEHQTLRDSTRGPEKALGERGARVADTVPHSASQQPESDPPSDSESQPSSDSSA